MKPLVTDDLWAAVEPLVHEDACVTFSNGAVHIGKAAVRKAYEANFSAIEDEEYRIVESTTAGKRPLIERVLSAEELKGMQEVVQQVPVAPYVIRYATKITRLTRKEQGEVPSFIRDYVTWGAGPRASQYLVLAAKSRAVLHGRYYVSCGDVQAVALPVMRHRIITNFNAEADGVTTDDIVTTLLKETPLDASDAATQRKMDAVMK